MTCWATPTSTRCATSPPKVAKSPASSTRRAEGLAHHGQGHRRRQRPSASQTIHDPTCGSGCCRFKAHDEAKSATGLDFGPVRPRDGQRHQRLARMNLILHDRPTGEIWQDKHAVCASYLSRTTDRGAKDLRPLSSPTAVFDQSLDQRLRPRNDQYGLLPSAFRRRRNRRLAFPCTSSRASKSTGKGAVILPHGVPFRAPRRPSVARSSGALHQGYHRSAGETCSRHRHPACILVLDKEGAAARKGIFPDRRRQGLHQRRQQEPPAGPRTSTRSSMRSPPV